MSGTHDKYCIYEYEICHLGAMKKIFFVKNTQYGSFMYTNVLEKKKFIFCIFGNVLFQGQRLEISMRTNDYNYIITGANFIFKLKFSQISNFLYSNFSFFYNLFPLLLMEIFIFHFVNFIQNPLKGMFKIYQILILICYFSNFHSEFNSSINYNFYLSIFIRNFKLLILLFIIQFSF